MSSVGTTNPVLVSAEPNRVTLEVEASADVLRTLNGNADFITHIVLASQGTRSN